jgi:Asp-tRNA(Asn)/Glu-tRNA(Gln) amidotransferase A subunit family amidase
MKQAILISLVCWLSLMLLLSLEKDKQIITGEHVNNSLNIIGMHMTETEIDSLLSGLEEYRSDYIEMRKYKLSNKVAPSLIFNPLPPNFKINNQTVSCEFEELSGIELPEKIDDLAFFSIGELAYLIKNQKITSVELTTFFIDRLKTHDKTLHCVISLTEDLALKQAAKADMEIAKGDYKGLLHGIPYGAKDLLATKDYKTSWGAEPFKDQAFDLDATVIQKLEEAGAILVAKLTLGALAWGDVWYGEKTRNPWDPSQGSSGSSAGSASSVSAGLVPFAIGTETYGSIVSPATVCGTTGLRPSFGRVSRFGAMALSWSMDKIGPICRSTEDCAIVFNAIRGKDTKDQTTVNASFNYKYNRDHTKLKIGYLKSIFESDYTFKKQDSFFLSQLIQSGYSLIPIELPEVPPLGHILTAEAAAAFDELTRSGQDDLLKRQVKNAWPNVFRAARFIPAVEYIQANRIRTELIEQMDSIMQTVDVYLTPSWEGPNLYLTNLTGHPQLVIPNGFIEGLPTSISIVGKLYGEAELLEFGKIAQELTGFHSHHPPGFN